jgi:hypothetical protein
MKDTLDDPDVVLVSGYARLPGGVTSQSQFEQLGVVLAVNIRTGIIVAADSTLLTRLAGDFLRMLVEGLSVYDDAGEIVARLQRRYAGQSGQALIAALRRCMENCVKLRGEWR